VIDVKLGAGGTATVNVTELVIPFGVVTVTVRAPVGVNKLFEMVKVAVTVVELTRWKALTVTPVPEMLTAVAPVRLVPTRVTLTTVPLITELGVIEVSVGTTTVPPWNSTAPASTALFVFLKLPKKSVGGASV
jgi:hypothetical protein